MTFHEFCKKWDSIFIFDGEIENTDVPEEYKIPLKNLVDSLKYKLNRLDKIEIGFIQSIFDKIEIEDFHKYFNEIPEGIFEELSKQLFGCSFKNASVDNIPIIKICGIYLLIQI